MPRIKTFPLDRPNSPRTDIALDALGQALYAPRVEQEELIHHSNRGVQGVSIKCPQRLNEDGGYHAFGKSATIQRLMQEIVQRLPPWVDSSPCLNPSRIFPSSILSISNKR